MSAKKTGTPRVPVLRSRTIAKAKVGRQVFSPSWLRIGLVARPSILVPSMAVLVPPLRSLVDDVARKKTTNLDLRAGEVFDPEVWSAF